jgi:5-methylcytosine-specific restriction enzyme subunit McrC
MRRAANTKSSLGLRDVPNQPKNLSPLPMTVAGQWESLSLLFPMEKLFERYVADCLKQKIARSATVVTQAASKHLCKHNDCQWFELQPDILVSRGQQKWVLDTKRKRLNQFLNTTKNKYLISQDDMYQMFAYGERYLDGAGEMLLIYPRTKDFFKTLPVFEFSKDLHLWAVAFDLETGAMVDDSLPESLKPVVGLAPWADAVH